MARIGDGGSLLIRIVRVNEFRKLSTPIRIIRIQTFVLAEKQHITFQCHYLSIGAERANFFQPKMYPDHAAELSNRNKLQERKFHELRCRT